LRLLFFDALLRHPRRPQIWQVLGLRVRSGEELLTIQDWDALQPRLFWALSAPARNWLASILVQLLTRQPGYFSNAEFCARLDHLHQAGRFASVAAVLAENQCKLPVETEEDREWRLKHERTERRGRLAKRLRRNRFLHASLAQRRTIQHLLVSGPDLEFKKRHQLWELIGTQRIKNGTSTLHNIVRATGWQRLTTQQQQQAADIACAVLRDYPVPPSEWYAPDAIITNGAADLHRALLICQQVRPAFLRGQSSAFWRAWARFLVRLKFRYGSGVSFELVQQAAEVAGDVIDQAVLQEAQRRYTTNPDDIFYEVTDWFPALPTAGFPELLLEALQAGNFAGAAGYVLTQLLQAGYPPAWKYARQLLPLDAPPPADPAHERMVLAVYRWLLFPQEPNRPIEGEWWTWWQQLATQPKLAVMLLNSVMRYHSPHNMSPLAKLTEDQLEELIVWLSVTYQLTDADVNDWAEQTAGGRIAAFRANLAAELAGRGSQLAWAGLLRLAAALDDPWWLRYRLDQVRENVRRNAWEPLQPDALATLSREADRRWVHSAADLQDVLLESLHRFQLDLHGELATAQVLWVPVRDPAHRSRITGQEIREENYFSDRLRQHLKQDLERSNLLIKREVEIRPSHGKGTGQRPDIYVEAFSRNAAREKIEVQTVLIEVKLSRNDEAETGLANQLGEYLTDQAYKHGIFLVGWHFGEYDVKPGRRLSRQGLLQHLHAEAGRLKPTYSIVPKVLDIRLPGDKERLVD
jgi:hypothetical protein